MPLRIREDFLNSTIFELLENYWLLRTNLNENENAKYYFWPPNMGSLERQWLLCLSELKFCAQKIEKLCRYFDPTSYADSEHYIE